MKSTTTILLFGGSALAVFHIVALATYLYWYYWWLDIIMHFTGGVLLVVCWYALPELRVLTTVQQRSWLLFFAFIAVCILSWEAVEWIFNTERGELLFIDSSIDVLFGVIGVGVALSVHRMWSNHHTNVSVDHTKEIE